MNDSDSCEVAVSTLDAETDEAADAKTRLPRRKSREHMNPGTATGMP